MADELLCHLKAVRTARGWTQASDHVPVILEMNL
jgi:endonuclease/exonuclease/phosphatase family metal-dependent hydrolase